MSTIGGLLFGNSPTPAVGSSQSGPPQWYQSFYQALLSQGSQAANAPYTANPNPRVAPLTADQNQAYANVANMVGAQQPLLNTAGQYATQGGQAVTPGQIQNYMNPYTNDVVNTIGNLAQRNLTENLLPAVNDTFTGAGQFGSGRNAQFTQQAVRNANESALNQQSQALQSGYSTALSAAQQDQARQLQAAGTLGGLASTGQQVGLQGNAALEAAGQSQQQNQQQNLDVLNQDWLTQQQYPQTQLSWLSGLFNPGSAGNTQTSTSTPSTQQPSALSQIIGGLGSIGSLLGGISSFFAEGGKVGGPGGSSASGEKEAARDPRAVIIARAKAAMAKAPEARNGTDQHAIMMQGVLSGMAAGGRAGPGEQAAGKQDEEDPWVEATATDEDGNTLAAQERLSAVEGRPPWKAPGNVRKARGGSIGALRMAA